MPTASPNSNRTRAANGLSYRILAIALLLGAPMAAQSPGTPPTPHPQVLDPTMGFNGFGDVSIAERQVKMLNIDRQKTIVSDTERILQLAHELNDDAVSGYARLSAAERMHKAEEIEKLAKNVREKMTYAIGAPPPVNSYTPWPQR